MQTTALAIITRAYKIVGLLGAGEPLTAERAADGLESINDMLDSWATDNLFTKQISELVATVPAGETFTVGPAGDVVTPLVPERLELGCFFRSNNVDFEFKFLTREQYMAYPVKNQTAPWPYYAFYDSGTTIGTVNMLPALTSPAEVHLQVQEPLTSFVDLTTIVTLPLGYKEAITLSAAERYCFGKMQVPPDIMKTARNARSKIRDANAEIPVMNISSVIPTGLPYNYRGYY